MRHDKSASEECDDETPKPGIRGIPVAMYNPGIYARTYVRPRRSHMCLSGTDVLGYRVDLADRQDSLNGVWFLLKNPREDRELAVRSLNGEPSRTSETE